MISPSEFRAEMLADLPSLMREYPAGPAAKDLAEYYGEALTRCLRTMQALHDAGKATLYTDRRGSYRIVAGSGDSAAAIIRRGGLARNHAA